MDKDIKKSYKLTMLVAILCLIVIVGSTTYAYFKTRIKGDGTGIDVSATTFDINIDESNMTLTSLAPIYDTDKETKANSKTFTVSSSNLNNSCLNLYLVIDEIGKNLSNKYVKYELIEKNDSSDKGKIAASGNFDGRSSGSSISLVKNSDSLSDYKWTIRIWLSYSDTDDQSAILTGSEDARTLKVHVKLLGTSGTCKTRTTSGLAMKDALLQDNLVIKERKTFKRGFTANTTGILVKTNKTEDGSDVYYYAGNTTNNWVKFGGYYWRIIRTNEDGSVRLLYAGTSPDTTDAVIDVNEFNNDNIYTLFNGYMYGTHDSLENNRQNTNDSTIKTILDKWYEDNLLINYDKYISKSAIYCNDRSLGEGIYKLTSSNIFHYGSYTRNVTNNSPSYKCGANTTDGLFETTQAVADKFSASTTGGGNGQLKYPIALMTADELVFAGASFERILPSPYAWYYTNSEGNSITGYSYWWTMSPDFDNVTGLSIEFVIGGESETGYLYLSNVVDSYAVRPVISLDKCALYASGDGTADNPYEIDYDNSCN